MFKLKRPIHPGFILQSEFLEPLGLDTETAAQILQITTQDLSVVLSGDERLSPELALRLEKAFGLDVESWLNMQLNFDAKSIRAREQEITVSRFVA